MGHELGAPWARQPNPCCSLLILRLSCMCSLLVWFLLPIVPVTIEPTYCVVTAHHAACCCICKKARQEPEDTAPFHPKCPQKNSHRWGGQDSTEPLFRKVLLQWPERSVFRLFCILYHFIKHIFVLMILTHMLQFNTWTVMEFPSSLSSNERAFLHRAAQSLGYSSKSKG